MMKIIRENKILASASLMGSAAVLVVVAFVMLTAGSIFDYSAATTKIDLPITPFDPNSVVARENQQPGTAAWQLDKGANTTFIQGYAGKVSAQPGESVPLYISSASPTTFGLDVYRIGWYQGLGGRLMLSAHGLKSVAQGIWTPGNGLQGCHLCKSDPQTHSLEANWRSTYTLAIGRAWLSGAYLIKMTTVNHAISYIFFVVRSDASSAGVLASFGVNTYAAYNAWGGYSLYGEDTTEGNLSAASRAYAASFDRPYNRGAGTGDFTSWDIHAIRWMERSSVDVTYTTDVDVSEQPNLLLHHRVFMALGHDEYWTLAMRNGIEAARDAGVSLAFMGANDSYWQNRYLPDSKGQPDRTVVCYKVTGANPTATNQPSLDPYYPQHIEQVTAQWRDRLLNRSESTLLGLEYHSIIKQKKTLTQPTYYPDWVVRSVSTLPAVVAGTGLVAGEHIKGGLVGYEYDGLGTTKLTPKKLQEIAESPLITNHNDTPDYAFTAYYMADSGAMVFDAGTLWWSNGLDELSLYGWAYQDNTIKGNAAISKLMVNILDAMFVATRQPPVKGTPTPTGSPSPAPTRLPTPTPAQHLAMLLPDRKGR